MNKKRMITLFALTIAMSFVAFTVAQATNQPTSNAEYMGYSNEILKDVIKLGSKAKVEQDKASLMQQNTQRTITEADAVQEQLTELGNTRNIISMQALESENIRNNVNKYWSRNGIQANKIKPLKHEFMVQIKAAIQNTLEKNGYKVLKLVLAPTNTENFVRGDVRVVRTIKSKFAYSELQQNLDEIKKLSFEAATISGVSYLSPMTVFIVENPRNNYYYEKTILTR